EGRGLFGVVALQSLEHSGGDQAQLLPAGELVLGEAQSAEQMVALRRRWRCQVHTSTSKSQKGPTDGPSPAGANGRGGRGKGDLMGWHEAQRRCHADFAGPGLWEEKLARRRQATQASTYGPLGITATRARGPYSARLSDTACSTDATGST